MAKNSIAPMMLVYNSRGELFFTDPPYGLEYGMNDPKKEMPFQGVFKVKLNGEVVLVIDTLTRPNGIAFLPGEKTLLISNSDPDKPNWYAFDVSGNDSLKNGRIFYSAAGYDKSLKGLPDGMKIDKNGNVFAHGPGGIWIFNKDGKLLGKIKVPDATSNCALSADEKTLYITNDHVCTAIKNEKINLTVMKVYKTKTGIVIEQENKFYLVKENNWDTFINDDDLFQK